MDQRDEKLDELAAKLDRHIASLENALPPVHYAPKSQINRSGRTSPLNVVRFILILFVIAAILLLIADVIAIFFDRDEKVFVLKEGYKFHVWRDSSTLETATGKNWFHLPIESRDPFATYHDARRNRALDSLFAHVLFLILAVIALRNVQKLRKAAEPGERQTPEAKSQQSVIMSAKEISHDRTDP